MGCSGSKTSSKIAPKASPTPEDSPRLRSNDRNGITLKENAPQIKENSWTEKPVAQENGVNETSEKKDEDKSKDTGAENNNNTQTVSELQACRTPQEDKGKIADQEKPKGVAFDISLTGSDKHLLSRRPHRLQKLESAPELTAQMLAQKMAAAEQNRQKELEKKAKRTSKRRKELIMAREMDNAQQQMAEKMVRQYEEKMSATDKNRAKAQAEIVAKQKKREERAKKVRDKARKIQDGDDIVHVAVDPDQSYNADVDTGDMWDDDASPPSSADWDNRNVHNIDEIIQDKQETILTEKDKSTSSIHDFFD